MRHETWGYLRLNGYAVVVGFQGMGNDFYRHLALAHELIVLGQSAIAKSVTVPGQKSLSAGIMKSKNRSASMRGESRPSYTSAVRTDNVLS